MNSIAASFFIIIAGAGSVSLLIKKIRVLRMNDIKTKLPWHVEWIDPYNNVHGFRYGSEDMVKRWAHHMNVEGYVVTVYAPGDDD
jgi:hypothetical protein